MNKFLKACTAIALTIGLSSPAAAVVIGFESLASDDIVDDQFLALGADFGGTAQVAEGTPIYPAQSGNLNIFDFTGSDTPGVIRVDAVGDTWKVVSGYVTANTPITLSAFDAANNLLGSDLLPTANFVGSGTGVPPNAFLRVAAVDIAYVTFSDSGNSFSVDTFSFIPTSVALPSTLALFAVGAAGFTASRRRSTG